MFDDEPVEASRMSNIDDIGVLAGTGNCSHPCDIGTCFLCKREGRSLINGGFGEGSCGLAARRYLESLKADKPDGRPMTEFKVGHWYKWVGPKDFSDNWNSKMEAWKDGRPRKCLKCLTSTNVEFSDIDGGVDSRGWYYYHCLEHFREVDPPKAKEKALWAPKSGRIVSFQYDFDGMFAIYADGRKERIFSGQCSSESRPLCKQTLIKSRKELRRKILGL